VRVRLTPFAERLYREAKSTRRKVLRDPTHTMTADELRALDVGLAGPARALSREDHPPEEGV
jgi:hypothetical protein